MMLLSVILSQFVNTFSNALKVVHNSMNDYFVSYKAIIILDAFHIRLDVVDGVQHQRQTHWVISFISHIASTYHALTIPVQKAAEYPLPLDPHLF